MAWPLAARAAGQCDDAICKQGFVIGDNVVCLVVCYFLLFDSTYTPGLV
jgi:hypothetical protein